MKLLKNKTIILFAIILIAFLLRFWQLGRVPVSPDWDEQSHLYNAYSLLTTGKDEYGVSFPVVIESFGDYKPALYTYLVIPSIQLFGLSTFAVRVPSAVAGVLTVYLTYLLVLCLLKKQNIALIAAGILAIDPWHIQFSRVAFEANIGVLCNVCFLYFFLRSLTHKKLLLLAALFACLGIYSYQSEKVFVPLMIFLTCAVYWQQIKKLSRHYVVAACMLFFVMISPMLVFSFTNPHALARAQGTSVFSNSQQAVDDMNKNKVIDIMQHDPLALLFNNKYIVFTQLVLSHYLVHFDPNWLFVTGDNVMRHQPPGMGHLYIVELPFLLIGLYYLLFSRHERSTKLLILFWLLAVPLPASVTFDVPNAVRTLNFLPMLQICIALGVYALLWYILRFRQSLRYIITLVVMSVIVLNVLYYFAQYFVQYNYYSSEDWQYGYQEAVEYTQEHSSSYQHIVVSNDAPMDQSYIFFLVATKYPPALYQQEHNTSTTEKHFDKYTFRHISWSDERPSDNVLYITGAKNMPDHADVLKTINFLDGKPAINILLLKG